ncbi:hypothetical protein RSOLAG22IIIB_01196 [Rhizoctonia solani]|uniref:DUF7918 domain-containing protein n=1 Tax=Rhizoctonia solani TaxID=456999 RepID=A0A0K6G4X9_9AGAM|nr:hypothetical protein RSOLAG22IIIB_01196 [Rhizoctonia solani]
MDIRYKGAIVTVGITDEYGDDLEMFKIRDGPKGSNKKECWIPCEEGETFRITWKAGASARNYKKLDLRAIPYLDGVKMDEGMLTASQRANGEYGCLGGQQVDVDVSCPFQFGNLMTTDDLALEGHGIHPSDLNTIKVVVEWGRSKIRELSPEDLDQARFIPPPERGLVHESAVKHMNYSAAILGSPVASNTSSHAYTYTFRRETNLERLTFIFHYGSPDWLRERNVMRPLKRPRSTPSTTPEYIDVDAFEDNIKTEPDAEVGTVQRPTTRRRVFLDSDEEIEVLKHLVPISLDGQRSITPIKVENEVKAEPEI